MSQLRQQFNLSEVQEVGTPEPRTVWNQFDEHGAVVGLSRNTGETNWGYRRRILDVFVHIANSSYQGLVHGITRETGLSLSEPIQINPRRSLVDDRFFASDPYVKVDGAWIYLYSDYAGGVLDHQIDRFAAGGNYEHLTRLVDFINATTYFEASLAVDADPYMPSMCLLNQSNRERVKTEEVPASTRFKLDNDRLVSGSLLFSDEETFAVEVSTEAEVNALGRYWVDYNKGILRAYRAPATGSGVGYEYTAYPFKPTASPVILHDINSEAFRVKMFEQVLQDDGSYVHGIPTELGTDIINELMSVTPMYWGV